MDAKKHTRRAGLLFFAALAVALLALQEAALRLALPLPQAEGVNRILYTNNSATPALQKQKLLCHTSFIYPSSPDGFAFLHKLNLYGFRDRDWNVDKDTGRPRVMIVGDSIVEGFGAPAEASIPAVFEKALRGAGVDAEVMNAGAGTMQVPNYVQLIRDMVPVFRPDSLILVLYFNDLPSPPFDPAWLVPDHPVTRRSPLEPRLFSLLDRMRRGEPVPRAWYSGPFPFFAAVPDQANWWSESEFAKRWGPFVRPDIRRAMEQGMFNPYVVGDAAQAMAWFRQPFDLSPCLRALDGFARKNGTRLFVAFVPAKPAVSGAYRSYLLAINGQDTDPAAVREAFQGQGPAVAGACAETALPFLDLSPVLQEHEDKGERMYWSYDMHLNPEGYAAAGRALAEWWMETGKGAGQQEKGEVQKKPAPEWGRAQIVDNAQNCQAGEKG